MDLRWTQEKEAEALNILSDKDGVEKNRRYYYVREKFQIVELGGLRRKRDGKLMATEESITSIITDVHAAK